MERVSCDPCRGLRRMSAYDCRDATQVVVTVKENNVKEAKDLKQLMHRESGSLIRNQVKEYLRCLREGIINYLLMLPYLTASPCCLTEYSKDLILPRRDSSPAQPQQKESVPVASMPNASLTTTNSASRPSG